MPELYKLLSCFGLAACARILEVLLRSEDTVVANARNLMFARFLSRNGLGSNDWFTNRDKIERGACGIQ